MSLNKYHGDIHTVLRAREDRRIKKKRQEKAEIKEVNPPGESHSHITCKRLGCVHHKSLPTRKSKNLNIGRIKY